MSRWDACLLRLNRGGVALIAAGQGKADLTADPPIG